MDNDTQVVLPVELFDLRGNKGLILLEFIDLVPVTFGVPGQTLIAVQDVVREAARPEKAVKALASENPVMMLIDWLRYGS